MAPTTRSMTARTRPTTRSQTKQSRLAAAAARVRRAPRRPRRQPPPPPPAAAPTANTGTLLRNHVGPVSSPLRLPVAQNRLLLQRRDNAANLPAVTEANLRTIAVLRARIAELEDESSFWQAVCWTNRVRWFM